MPQPCAAGNSRAGARGWPCRRAHAALARASLLLTGSTPHASSEALPTSPDVARTPPGMAGPVVAWSLDDAATACKHEPRRTKTLLSWSATMWASGPAAAARPVEAGLGPARDGWPPTSALALLVKMAAVAIAATVVQFDVQRAGVCRLLSHFAHARAARPASLREGMSLPRFDPAAKSCSPEPRPTLPSRPQLLSSSQKTGASYAASLRMLPASLAVRCTTRMC